MKILIIFLIIISLNSNEFNEIDIKNNLKKLKVYEISTNNYVNKIYFCKNDKDKFFLLKNDGKIYFTLNFGKNWEIFNSDLLKIENFKNIGYKKIYQNYINIDTIIFINKDNYAIYSNDCGKSFKFLSKKINEIKFHNFDKNIWAIIFVELNINELYITKNQGTDINFLKSNINYIEWNKYKNNIENYYYNRIFYLVNSNNKLFDLYYSDDFLNTEFIIKQDIENFFWNEHFLLFNLKKLKYSTYITTSFSNFHYVYNINLNKTPNYTYKIKYIEENKNIENYIITQGFSKGIQINNLYTNKNNYFNFFLVLKNIVCSLKTNECDLFFINNLDGIILVNSYSEKIISKIINNQYWNNKKIIKKLNRNINSLISFDYGKNFQNIYYNNSKKLKINLIIKSSNKYQGIIFSKNAPGIILSWGSYGNILNHKLLNLFISVNGGFNWNQILDGNYLFEIWNNGTFILAGKRNIKTKYIIYSHNYGKTWFKIKISNNYIKIKSFVIENDKNDIKIIILSSYRNKKLITTLDFDDYFEKICHIDDNINLSDYEPFTPNNYNRSNCLNGKKIIYFRKKPNNLCYNDNNTSLTKIIKYCKCTDKDWDCDFGYEKDKNEKCVKSLNSDDFKNILRLSSNPIKKCLNFYFDNNGYIKNINNHCKEGINHKLQKKSCLNLDIELGKHLNKYIYWFILSIILIFLFLGINNFKNRNIQNKKSLNELEFSNKINN